MLSPAERLLQDLGVTEPREIDLEAIAYHVNARIRYRPLDGCEACIVGGAANAIISVNNASSARRKRFSIAHELGHWHHHRGRRLACRVDDAIRPPGGASPEQIANGYAADLLMPYYLFRPLARSLGAPTLKAVDTLAEIFKTSRSATAIRLVESDQAPALLICHSKVGKKWFVRSKSVPSKWWPREDLDQESFAFGVQFGDYPEGSAPRKIGADAWFDRRDAERYEVYEQTMRTSGGDTLTLVTVRDPKMLDD
jgi:hypothetical protein